MDTVPSVGPAILEKLLIKAKSPLTWVKSGSLNKQGIKVNAAKCAY